MNAMRYLVQAQFTEEKMEEFFRKLSDNTIALQKPDGQEILRSMHRARITKPGVIQWHETCYCSPPLAHERATVYDHYFTDIQTCKIDSDPNMQGDSFWDYLLALQDQEKTDTNIK